MSETLLRTEGADPPLPRRQAACRGRRCTRSTTSTSDRPRRDRRPGGRERQRQEHDRAAARARLPADARRDLVRGPAAEPVAGAQAAARVQRRDVPMVFQDPYSSLNPAYRVSHGILRGIKLHRAELSAAARRDQEVERVLDAVGLVPAADIAQTFPLRAERRPAAAGRLRAGARVPAEADRRRRAGLDARRLDPGRRPQPDGRAARARGRLVPLHHPRRRERPLHRRPRPRACTPATSSRKARPRTSCSNPKHPYTQLLALGRARSARRARPRRRARRRRAAEGRRSRSRGLPLPAALPARGRAVRDRDAAATRARARAAASPATSPPRTSASPRPQAGAGRPLRPGSGCRTRPSPEPSPTAASSVHAPSPTAGESRTPAMPPAATSQ